ncbi:UNVERIFIED_CONTAM: lec-1 [Trichonephila clavipes]
MRQHDSSTFNEYNAKNPSHTLVCRFFRWFDVPSTPQKFNYYVVSCSFTINWQSGPAKFDDILFQLNPKLEEGRVVRNSRLDDEMGKEESSADDNWKTGMPFHLIVGVGSLGFETRLEGKEWISFPHRHDASAARTLFMEGDMQPSDISINLAQLNPLGILNGTNIKTKGVRLQHICPELPLNSRVTGGFEKGCLLLLSGKVNIHPSRNAWYGFHSVLNHII